MEKVQETEWSTYIGTDLYINEVKGVFRHLLASAESLESIVKRNGISNPKPLKNLLNRKCLHQIVGNCVMDLHKYRKFHQPPDSWQKRLAFEKYAAFLAYWVNKHKPFNVLEHDSVKLNAMYAAIVFSSYLNVNLSERLPNGKQIGDELMKDFCFRDIPAKHLLRIAEILVVLKNKSRKIEELNENYQDCLQNRVVVKG